MTKCSSIRTVTLSAIGLIALTLSACGSDDAAKNSIDTSGAGSPADAGLVVESGPGIKWDSEAYTTAAGPQTVALVNRDSQLHSLVFVDADNKTLPGELEVGANGDEDAGEFDFAAGTYKLVCTVPGHESMRATLTVE